MSDRKNLSDYNKPRTDLNKLLPEYNLKGAKILEGLNENLFNRFLTKDEVERIVGIVGSNESATQASNQIQEPDAYRQANQLQPIAYAKVGNVDWLMSFVDFMNRLEQLGVDISRFNEWGRSLQFNWVPPIDLDKLINYQDYFWDSAGFDDQPQYVTIKNQCTWVQSRLTQILRSVAAQMPTYNIVGWDDVGVNEVWIDGNQTSTLRTGELIVLTGASVEPTTATVVSTFYNVGSDRTEVEISGYDVIVGSTDIYSSFSETEVDIVSFNQTSKTIRISGDRTKLFTSGYVFSVEESASSQPVKLFSVSSSTYDSISGLTSVVVNEQLGTTFDWSLVTVKPLIRSVQAEHDVICNTPYSVAPFGTFTEADLGNIIWVKYLTIVSPRTTSVLEGVNLGSQLFTDSDPGKDFLADGVRIGDILRVSTGTKDTFWLYGDHPITNVVTSNVLQLEKQLFTEYEIDYSIVRPRLLSDIESDIEPAGIDVNQLWFDTENDQLCQWDGLAWIVVVENFSLLVDINYNAHLIDLDQDDDWSVQNKWVHRAEITSFTGKYRAQHPIIEYFPYLKLSQHSFSDKKWRYRRDDTVSYATSDIEPSLFELIDTRVTSLGSGEVAFQNATTILFAEKFGNLTSSLTAGTQIQLLNFGINTGTYEVVSSEFVQLAPNTRYRTRVVISEAVPNPLIVPVGAHVAPLLTSAGDPWVNFETYHWQFEGVEAISASSIEPEVNPMLSEVVSTTVDPYAQIESIVGLVFQEYKGRDGLYTPTSGATYELDASLHDLALYEDFQEGDVRVYINGVRQYGNFVDVESTVNSGFVGAIQFDPSVTIQETDVVRIELGEYASSDVGKRNVLVNTVSGTEQFNLVDIRRVEQVKNDRSQYPYFNTYSVHLEPLRTATEIFKYADDSSGTYFPALDQRVFYDAISRDYSFEQKLIDPETDELYLYYDRRELGNEYQSIWKKGLHLEQYVPVQENGFWGIPNQLYYNVNHENRETLKLTELFRHFNTIIAEQSTPGIVAQGFTNSFRLDNVVNYGLGGRIKEHNDGFDMLMSAMFVNNVNPIDLIQFAQSRYDNNQITFKEIFTDNIVSYFTLNGMTTLSQLTDYIKEDIKDRFEKNDKLDQWFGDSTTYDDTTDVGVKNHIATIPFLGLTPKYKPYLLVEDDFLQLVHHDGHRSDISFNPATIESMFRLILNGTNSETQTVSVDTDPFPALINGAPPVTGDIIVRTVTSLGIRKLYRFSSVNSWEFVDISRIFAEILLNIEENLYVALSDDVLPENLVPKFDLTLIRQDAQYTTKVQEQFSRFVRDNSIISPYINHTYVQNDPFTWNYAYTPIVTDPVTLTLRTEVRASWQALYDLVYNTPYPHLEPWRLQGYLNKPDYWDSMYASPTTTRKWLPIMWSNILTGIIPLGETAPDGNVGLGTPNQIINLYNYIPVNIDSTPTADGYGPDELLPPYWNSNNSSNPYVRSLYDAGQQEFIVTPSAGYEFGQLGPDEWSWSVSSQRLYDDLIVSFRLQPMRFMNQTFDAELVDVACLQVDDKVNKVASHRDVIFHGDMVDTEMYKSDGLNQWYVHFNRYNGFDGISAEFRQMWKDWDTKLTYQFGAFIDSQNFKISSDIFDITTSDYSLIFKKSQGIRDVWLDGFTATLLSTPSRFNTDTNDGLGWTVSFNNTSPISRPIEMFGVQNYPVRITVGGPTFKIFSFKLEAAEIQQSVGFDVVQYSETLAPTVATELNNDTTQYYASVLFNGVTNVPLVIQGNLAQTFGDLVDQINLQLGNNGNAFLRNGNLIIESGLTGGSTETVITDAGLFSTASSQFLGTSGNNIADIKFEKVFYVKDNLTSIFPIGSEFNIVDSTNFNRTYRVVSSVYSPDTELTKIEVNDDFIITDSTVDGYLEPVNAPTLPDSWTTGIAVHWSGNGTSPVPFNTTRAFYLIRVSDREFQLALTEEGAYNGVSIAAQSSGSKQQYVGRVKNTFTAFGGRYVAAYWKQHFIDNRVVNVLPTPVTVSGIQNIIDFINGYSGYLINQGFSYKDIDGTNRDITTGRARDWQLETEQLIEFVYNSRQKAQALREEYTVIPDYTSSTFTSTNAIQWNTGTRVTLDVSDGGQLPAEFNSPIYDTIAYYVIQTATLGRLQLAASVHDARAGIPVQFSDNGSGEIVLRLTPSLAKYPSIELNPHVQTIFIEHDTGIVADIFAGSKLDLITDQRVYDTEGKTLGVDDIIISRKDLRTQIELSQRRLEANSSGLVPVRLIGGMHIYFDGYEHVIQFNNYSTDNVLIYDSFLGINTPRFFMEFDRQPNFTLRPNVGGNVILGEQQLQNLEAAVESLRYAYSTYRSKEGDEITKRVRESLGYDGPYEFADDLGITDKSQFLFYRGLIQKKGTNFAVNAFTNQLDYNDIEIDEFWAYRVGTYGDSKERVYPELKLFSTDVIRKELRLEFVPPLTAASDSTFQAIQLTDESRWFEQPDQFEKLDPRNRFYINVKVQERFEAPATTVVNGEEYLVLSKPADAAYINYEVPASSPRLYLQLTEGVNYEFVTKTLIRFFGPITPLTGYNVNVSTLAYSYDAQNPAKLLNRKDGTVISDVPIWNPARQQYYSKAIYGVDFRTSDETAYALIVGLTHTEYAGYFNAGSGYFGGDVITLSNGATIQVEAIGTGGAVDEFTIISQGSRVKLDDELTQVSTSISSGSGFTLTVIGDASTVEVIGKRSSDPARYNTPVDTGDIPATNFWDARQKDKVWFYTGPEGYLPFDEPAIETDSNVRFKNWGKLAEWGEIKVYQWTESDVHPDDYDALAIRDELESTLPMDLRKTGRVRTQVFRNIGTTDDPIWKTEEDEHYDFVKDMVDTTSYPDNLLAETVEIYVNGIYEDTTSFDTASDFYTFVSNLSGTLIHVIKRATEPTQQQIAASQYKLDTPYSVVNRINPISGEEELKYYFWVEDRLSSILIKGGQESVTTLKSIKEGLNAIPTPYMVPNNIVDLTSTPFAELFITNSPVKDATVSYEFPFAYNQLVIKGLAGTVQADDAYTLRFTRDFALRDSLANLDADIREAQLKNIHTEWKLFREKQFEKIDRTLWNEVIESILGFEYDGEPLQALVAVTPTPTPSVSPSPTSTPLAVTPTATPTRTPPVTPTLTPNPSPTISVTPSVTRTPAVPTVTPTVTPTKTPVASPTPAPSGTVGFFDETGTPVVGNILSINLDSSNNPAATVNTSLTFNSSSVANPYRVLYSLSGGETPNRYWIYPLLGNSSNYEIRFTLTSGAVSSGSSTGVWLNMGTTRSWTVTRTGYGTSTAEGLIEIRNATTQAVVFSRNASISSVVLFINLGDLGDSFLVPGL